MPQKRVDASRKARGNYIWLLDLAVLAGTVIIARREDGVAIALSALIVTSILVVCRWLAGFSGRAGQSPAARQQHRAEAPVVQAPQARRERDDNWLRQD